MGACCTKSDQVDKEKDLTTLSFSKLPDFTMANTNTKAKVVSVYDADTIRVVFEFRGEWCKKPMRIHGIDAPEIKPPRSIPDRELHMEAGRLARDVVSKWILGRVVTIHLEKEDKYGRALGSITMGNGKDLSQELIKAQLALPYGGKTKNEWTRVDLTYCISSARHLLSLS